MVLEEYEKIREKGLELAKLDAKEFVIDNENDPITKFNEDVKENVKRYKYHIDNMIKLKTSKDNNKD